MLLMKHKFSQQLTEYRKKAKMTKTDVAKVLGIKSQFVGDVESGRAKPFMFDKIMTLVGIFSLNEAQAATFVESAFLERVGENNKMFLDFLNKQGVK